MAFVINSAMAEEIWRVLVDRAGASDSLIARDNFVSYARGKREVQEYRFMGHLGMGGKVRINGDRWDVYYYPEDKTPLRETIAGNANHDLAMLRLEWLEE
jgi:hypothetical protein